MQHAGKQSQEIQELPIRRWTGKGSVSCSYTEIRPGGMSWLGFCCWDRHYRKQLGLERCSFTVQDPVHRQANPGQELRIGTWAGGGHATEAMKELCLLACSPWLPQLLPCRAQAHLSWDGTAQNRQGLPAPISN